MAAINVKIADALKNQRDCVLREHELNATQYITFCWQYLTQYRSPPFSTDKRLLTIRDAIVSLAGQFSDALVRLQAVGSYLLLPSPSAEKPALLKQEIICQTSEIRQKGMRLEGEPEHASDEVAVAADTGFTFLCGYSEFYLCHDDGSGAYALVPVSELATELAAVVDAAVLQETECE